MSREGSRILTWSKILVSRVKRAWGTGCPSGLEFYNRFEFSALQRQKRIRVAASTLPNGGAVGATMAHRFVLNREVIHVTEAERCDLHLRERQRVSVNRAALGAAVFLVQGVGDTVPLVGIARQRPTWLSRASFCKPNAWSRREK